MLIPRLTSKITEDFEMGFDGVCWIYALVAPVDIRFGGMSINFDAGMRYDKCPSVKYAGMVSYRNENCFRVLRLMILLLPKIVDFGDCP